MKESNKREKEDVLNAIRQYLKVNKISTIKDWYKKGNQGKISKSYVSKKKIDEFCGGIVKALEEIFPNDDVLPWCFIRMPIGYFEVKDHRNKYIKWLYKELKLKSLEDWYKVKERDFSNNKGGTLLNKFNSQELIEETYDYVFEWGKKSHVSANKTKDKNYQKWRIKQSMKEQGISFSRQSLIDLDVAKIRDYKGGKSFLHYYDSFPDCLIKVFPEMHFKISEFSMKGTHYSNKNIISANDILERVRRYLDIREIKTIQDWYKLADLTDLANYVLPVEIKLFFKDIFEVLEKYFFKGINIYPWYMKKVPEGYWDSKDNRVKYILWLYTKLNLTSYDDWYSVTEQEFKDNRGGSLRQFGITIKQLLDEAYPDKEFEEWDRENLPNGVTENIIYQRIIVERALREKNLSITKEVLLTIEEKIIRGCKGGARVLSHYETYIHCLIHLFPEMNLNHLDFNKKGRGFWNDKNNFKPAIIRMCESCGYFRLEQYYEIRCEDFQNHGLYAILDFYNHSPKAAIIDIFGDEYDFDPAKFTFKSKTQQRAYYLIQCIFSDPDEIIELDYKHKNMRFKNTNRPMELDIYLPNKNFAIEIQGKQHREEVPLWGSLEKIQDRDRQKKKRCKDLGIQLIEIHDNEWDGTVKGFLKFLFENGVLIDFDSNKFLERLKLGGLFNDCMKEDNAETFGFFEEEPSSVRKGWQNLMRNS